MYFAELYGNRIRRITLSTGQVSTIAGTSTTGAQTDGYGTQARLAAPMHVALGVDPSSGQQTLYFFERGPLVGIRAMRLGAPCAAGTYNAPGSTAAACTPCSAGVYCPPASNSSAGAGACPRGYVCEAGVDRKMCNASFYCAAGASAASDMVACASGQYCGAGSGAAAECAAGSVCVTPATQHVCDRGVYCPASSTAALVCPNGSYCPRASALPLPCPLGSFCATPAAAALCPAGAYCVSNATAPITCDPGQYCPAGATAAAQCAVGYVCATPASQVCAAMFYMRVGRNSKCVPSVCLVTDVQFLGRMPIRLYTLLFRSSVLYIMFLVDLAIHYVL